MENVSKFVKHFMFWILAVCIVTLSVMTGLNAGLGQTANALVDGILVVILLIGVYFIFCVLTIGVEKE